MWLFRTISAPYLRQHKLRTLLTFIGIATGVATMIATGMVCDSVFSSFARTIDSAMGGADLRVTAAGLGLPATIADDLRAVPEVSDAGPMVDGFVSLAGSPDGEIAVIGIDVLADARSADKIRRDIIKIPDQLAFLREPDSVIVPEPLASEMRLRLGSSLAVVAPTGPASLTIRGTMPGGGIAALFGGRVALMDLPAAQALLGEPDHLDNVDLWLVKGSDTAAAVRHIEAVLGGRGWVENGESAEQRERPTFRILEAGR
jgi:ABC-type lipoprotein release transport system permease subunit